MTDTPTTPQEEEVGLVALDLNDALTQTNHMPYLTADNAMATYRMMMSGIVSRLFLYLYGEIDRELAERAVAVVDERLTVYREIVHAKVAPMRAVYEYLISHRVITREELGEEANAYLDKADLLQSRILEEGQTAPAVVDEPPTYSVPAEVNLVHVGPVPAATAIGTADPSKVTHWGPRTEILPDSVLQQTWAKIRLNGEPGPKVGSRYSLLYDPKTHGE